MPQKFDWSYEQKDVLDEVKDNLPDKYLLLIYLVTSGDTGKKYWVQLMLEYGKTKDETLFVMCDCNQGKFRLPLTVLGLKDHFCKHVKNLLEFLDEKKWNVKTEQRRH